MDFSNILLILVNVCCVYIIVCNIVAWIVVLCTYVLMSVKSFLKLMFFCYYDMPTLNKAYLILSYLQYQLATDKDWFELLRFTTEIGNFGANFAQYKISQHKELLV